MKYVYWNDADNVIVDEYFGTEDMMWTMYYIPSSEPSDTWYSTGNTEVDYILYDGVSNYFQYSINGQLETYQITDNMVGLIFSPID